MNLDWKDCKMLNILQENSRTSLTAISKEIDLSVDATKKRMNKMIKNDVFYPKIQLRPRNFGFNNIVDVKIKLKDHAKEKEFLEYLKRHRRVAELFKISGEWDISMVFIAKSAVDQGKVTEEIRNGFGDIIQKWDESLTTDVYRFETYDMLELMQEEQEGENVQG